MGIPCYLDKLSPQAWQLPEGARYRERPFDFGKIWWAHRFAQLGYSSMYMDNDVVLQKDPISAEFLQTSYDIQVIDDTHQPGQLQIALTANGPVGMFKTSFLLV